MKAKIFSTIAISALAALASSCDMDLAPIATLDEETAIQNTNDAMRFRNNFYNGIRALSSSQFYTLAEMQADCFNGLVINANRMGTLANGSVLSSDDDITSYWASLYSLINNVNYFVATVEPLYQKAVADNDQRSAQDYARYLAEAHFFRGYYYAVMFDRYCPQYTADKGDTPALGLPIVTVYNPTADRASYPGRNTMNETIAFIKSEMQLGYDGIMQYEEIDDSNCRPMASYISHYAIAAMQARFALWIGDYQTAIDKANEVINSGVFTISSRDDYAEMWTDDNNKEIIFLPFESNIELSNAIGSAWLGAYDNQADYIPSSQLISNLMIKYNTMLRQGDIRFTAFVTNRNLSTDFGAITTPCFSKFPGNPELQTTSTNNLVNKPKTFRLSELYLILAEAAYNKGDAATANAAIKVINDNRYKGRTYTDLTGSALMSEIILQRTLELVGEGFRLSDLRRWKIGFVRTHSYADLRNTGAAVADIEKILTPAGLTVEYAADDYRYTWPIPSDEIDVNPQMKGQQNPGY